uniref:Uncharacterized protein n=1 Tax=Steinernema glaseri TaxID=37863 RepID=A0A1I7Y8C2_9BILA
MSKNIHEKPLSWQNGAEPFCERVQNDISVGPFTMGNDNNKDTRRRCFFQKPLVNIIHGSQCYSETERP